MLWLPPAAPSRFGLVLAEPCTASGRTPQPKARRGQAGPYEHLIATGDHRRSDRQAQCFSWCSQGSSRCSCSPARGRGAVSCGARPEAVLGSVGAMPNVDEVAGGSREREQRLKLQGREDALLSAMLGSEEGALALAATFRGRPAVSPRRASPSGGAPVQPVRRLMVQTCLGAVRPGIRVRTLMPT